MRKRNPNDLDNAESFRVADLATRNSVGQNVIFDAIKKGELEASKLGNAPRSPVVVTRKAWERYLDRKRIIPRREPEAA